MANERKYLSFKTCDPLRTYNTLEPRPRQVDFERSLQAEIYDPLWMLTRQWQFGELKGEDTGSAIFAKVCLETTNLTKFKVGNEAPKVFDNSHLLEDIVESELPSMDYKTRLQSGQQFIRMLVRAGISNVNTIKATLKTQYPIEVPDAVDMENDSNALIIEKARIEANKELHRFLHAVGGKAMDGVLFYEDLQSQNPFKLPPTLNLTLPASQRTPVKNVAIAYMAWFEKSYGLPAQKKQSAWVDEQLEYQFACALPNKDGDNTVLTATEYYNGNLDWYSFDVSAEPKKDARLKTLAKREQTISENTITEKTLTVIPTEARFGGMPNARWWEFEDGNVDLGNVNADTTDIAKIILTQFALVFSNDWFVVPYTVPVGSMSSVKGIVVTDVFGQKTFVEAANQGETDDWMSWGMYNLSTEQKDKAAPLPSDTRLFFPPVVTKIQESDPISSVNLLRDEMANTVWGVEDAVPSLLGSGRDGHAAAIELVELLNSYAPPVTAVEPDESALLSYQLGNTVPENWIPFVPRHIPDQNRAITLQRASMPRLFNGEFSAVRPQTDIMRFGIKRAKSKELWPFVNSDGDKQPTSYFVNEEEVPRAGAIVTSRFQRARWYNGAVHSWYGRRKIVGRGEGSSGLQYDTVEPVKK
ncbi:hypothetical protein [uncultured Kriegella sp.]|uniref:hypothetical protein n=1 Tax=uncultured Kriegella sp. TaxID=1798910 RepID=UPI0030DB94B6|tara:strand:- start:70251 stop:72176 length:1926 start_codon:yes stop_codon:yes gene_type:complete